ncbi:hypothetical protein [Micromonospora arida]|uniref:hypothetical protein n=1 Tax=Micromonospora arida TaxID=2203715 RepID=UPI003405395E
MPRVGPSRVDPGHLANHASRPRQSDVLAGYRADVDLDVNRAWWSLRSLLAIRWLVEHGFDPWAPGCEVDVLRSSTY